MQVSCGSIEEFLVNLEGVDVHRKTVHFSTISRPAQQPNRFDIVVQASAVVEYLDGSSISQFLLEAGEACGRDLREVGDADDAGSRKAAELRERVKGVCDLRGWRVMPGIIGV